MSPRPQRATSSQSTRDGLVAAATAVVVERGYGGATARAIAARAGCNQALIFYHFGSIDQLLVVALESVSSRRMASFGAAVAEVQTLAELLDVFDRIVEEDVRTGDLSFLVALLDAGRSREELRRAVTGCLQPWQELTEQLIARLAGRHPLGLLVPKPAAARMAMALVLGVELLNVVADGRPSPVRELASRLRLLVTDPRRAGQ